MDGKMAEFTVGNAESLYSRAGESVSQTVVFGTIKEQLQLGLERWVETGTSNRYIITNNLLGSFTSLFDGGLGRDRSKSGGSALHRRAMTVLNGGGSGRDEVSRLKGVEPLGLVQGARGREAEERKPIAPGLTGQTVVS
jgi:hypothetical protein